MAESIVIGAEATAKSHHCLNCGTQIYKRGAKGRNPRWCEGCRNFVKYEKKLAKLNKSRKPPKQAVYRKCGTCRKTFEVKHNDAKFCSNACAVKRAASFHKKRVVGMCRNCGCVFHLTQDQRSKVKADKDANVFCDNGCANDYKSIHNRQDEYRRKIGWYDTRVRWEKANEEARKNRWKCCCWCGVAHTRVSRWCGRDCEWQNKLLQTRRRYQRASGIVTCIYCGKDKFVEHNFSEDRKYCSARCSARSAKKSRCKRIRSVSVGPVNFAIMMQRQKGKCIECGVKMTMPDGTYKDTERTLDHIVPLSKGGWHSQGNLQLLCRHCNCKVKGDSMKPGAQLMLPLQ